MPPLRHFWRRRCPSKGFERKLSLAYNLHEPHLPEPGHAPLIVLHGLFGSKQNNRSISKYGFSCLACHVCHLIGIGHLQTDSKPQCMRLSVLEKAAKEICLADYAPGYEKSWRLTPQSNSRLFSDGR